MSASDSERGTFSGMFDGGMVMSSEQVKPRAGRDAENTKSDILLAAMHEFAEYGDHGARIDRIAKRANANKSLIYAYFGNKEDLYAAALREAYIQIRSGENQLDMDQLTPDEAVSALIEFTMEHFLRAPWFLRLLATENLRRGQAVKNISDIAKLQSPLIEMLSTVLQRGVDAKLFRDDVNATDLYILIVSFFYFPISNVYTLPVVFGVHVGEREWLDARLQMAKDMILGYLKKKD